MNREQIQTKMDSIGICSVCSVSRDLFIPLVCSHTICLECSSDELIRDNHLACPVCQFQTQLEIKTLQRIKKLKKQMNPEIEYNDGRTKQLESSFRHCIESINKTFKYLHQQLNLKAQALINSVTQQYQSEMQKLRIMIENQDHKAHIPQSFHKFLRMLRGLDYTVEVKDIQREILSLKFNTNLNLHIHKHSRCQKRQQSSHFQNDKSYTKIIGILNKSRSTLDSHMKTLKKSIMYRSPDKINMETSKSRQNMEDSFD